MTPRDDAMSAYDEKRWRELQAHWDRKGRGRKALLSPRAREALDVSLKAAKDTAAGAGRKLSDITPDKARETSYKVIDATLVPTVKHVAELLELLNEWIVELNDPEAVLDFHRKRGREVGSVQDLRSLELRELEEATHGMALRWRTLGAGEGAALGSLAMIPVPVLGSVLAIGLDFVAMQALTVAVATRVCHSYGYDPQDPEIRHVVDRMVARAYRDQVAKAGSVKKAGAAFSASKGRVNWSQKLREDHRLMAAVEKLLKQVGDGRRVPVKNARMGMPAIAMLAGAATNSHILADTVTQARHYGATLLLAEKYGLELPQNLRQDLKGDLQDEEDK